MGSSPTDSFIFVIYGLLIFGLGSWADAQGTNSSQHTCNVETGVNKWFPCKDMQELLVMTRWNLNYEAEESPFLGLSKEEIMEEMTRLMKTTENCMFSKTEMKSICCHGWNGANCDQPICARSCLHGGTCIGPDACLCIDGYTGEGCMDVEADISSLVKYCYQSDNCFGIKTPLAAGGPVEESFCCQRASGKSWGIFGECTTCALNEDDISAEFKPDSFSVVEQTEDLGFRTCMSYGPVYYRTADGLEFYFAGRCSYLLYQYSTTSVIVEMIDCHRPSTCRKKLTITLNTILTVEAQGSSIKLKTRIDASTVDVEDVIVTTENGFSKPGISANIRKEGQYFLLAYGPFRVRWDNEHTYFISRDDVNTAEGDTMQISGLCGNFDGDPLNDAKKRNGQDASSPAVVGNSYKVSDGSPNECPDTSVGNFNCLNTQTEDDANTRCRVLLDGNFQECHNDVAVAGYFSLCVATYCGVHRDNQHLSAAEQDTEIDISVCSVLNSYSELCGQRRSVFAWRSQHLCPKTCEIPGQEFTECALKCPLTCRSVHATFPKDCFECFPGCRCAPGTILHNETCIPVDQCPCFYQGQEKSSGSVIKQQCNSCECAAGMWLCSDYPCSHTCSVVGFQHISTFDGADYDFVGADCSYTLVEIRPEEIQEDDSLRGILAINLKLVDCTGKGYSCSSSVEVMYQSLTDDWTTTVVVNKFLELIVNGQSRSEAGGSFFANDYIAAMPATTLFYSIQGYGFHLLYDTNGRIYIILDPYYRTKVQGICGNYDQDIRNEHTGADNMPTNIVDAVQSYSTDCQTTVTPDYNPENPCDTYSQTKPHAIELCNNVGIESVFKDCYPSLDWSKFRTQCQYDVCASSDTDDMTPMCTQNAAMAHECAKNNITINWLEDYDLKILCQGVAGYSCDGGQVFSQCPHFMRTCRDLDQKKNYQIDSDMCFGGCHCENGKVYNELESMCVTPDSCPCIGSDNTYYVAGEEIVNRCGICHCRNGTIDCEQAQCAQEVTCPNNMVYIENLITCGHTCGTLNKFCTDLDTLRAGCGCEDGYVESHNRTCILPELCPCHFSENVFEAKKKKVPTATLR